MKKEIFHIEEDRLLECIILERINRFVVRVKTEMSAMEKAHINNTGRLKDLLKKGKIGYCIKKNTGKTRYRLFAIKENKNAAIIDTYIQMTTFEKALRYNYLQWLNNCSIDKRNVKLYSSKIDYLIKCAEENIYLEVKSATMRDKELPYIAMYPDCPTLRGRKHIHDLVENAKNGGKSMILFIAGLSGIRYFKPYRKGDPLVYNLLKIAKDYGVIIKGINIYFEPNRRKIILEIQI